MSVQGADRSDDSYLPEHGNGGYRVNHYDLEIDYRPSSDRLSGRARIEAVAGPDPLSGLSLDLGDFTVERVLVEGRRPAKYTHRAGKLRIRTARPLAAGSAFTVEVRYVGVPKPVRTKHWGDLGWEPLHEGALVASQPIGAPSWFPCDDRPAAKASYRIAVTAPTPFTVVANGVLESRTISASTTTWVYEQAEPMASYLATVQIGPYDVVDDLDGRIPLRGAVPAWLRDRFDRDFGRQPRMMALFEDRFGPYPFEEYGVVVVDEDLEVPVEAQTLSVFGANHVDGRRGSERLVAHELAHQWFGNSLTVADWRHIWLNEGFAKYAEWLWSEESGGPSAREMAGKSHARLALLRQDLRVADPGVRRMFDDRVYERGALTLHALRVELGDDAFFALLREWAATNRHGCVTTDEFTALAERRGARRALFRAWLHERALPPLP